MATVGENIKKIRKKKGLTQKQLGELCGMSTSYIAQYENDLRNPKLDTLKKIADALNISIFDLLDEKDEKNYNPNDLKSYAFSESIVKHLNEKSEEKKQERESRKDNDLQYFIDRLYDLGFNPRKVGNIIMIDFNNESFRLTNDDLKEIQENNNNYLKFQIIEHYNKIKNKINSNDSAD